MSQNIRIFQLGSPSGMYGAERWILTLSRYLDPGRFETWIGAVNDSDASGVPLCKIAKASGFPIHVIESFGRLNISAVIRLRRFLLHNNFHILHTHGYKTDLIGLLATRGTACKILATPHGWSKHPDYKLWCYEKMDRCIFPFFDAVVPLSDPLYQSLRKIPGLRRKLALVQNGVDIDEIDQQRNLADELVAWRGGNQFIIGFIGRLIADKGLDVLFHAVAKYGHDNWCIVIVGEGKEQQALTELARQLGISKRVLFCGYRRDRLSFLKAFDAFVLPSKSEGIPRCVMEAMAAGIPVIVSNIPGCRTLVDGKTTGLRFTQNSPQELANAINRVIDDPVSRKTLQTNGRKFIQEHFSASRMAQEYDSLFQSILSS